MEPWVADRAGTRAALALSVLMVAWGVAIPLVPTLAFRNGWPALVSSLVYAAGAEVCHQRPERSFHTAARSWPVCARCAGIYLAGAVAAVVLAGFRRAGRRVPVRAGGWPAVFALALAPIAATWLLERAGGLDVGNIVRAASGAPLGCAVAIALASLVPGRPRT